jgi:hypothetical protein
MMTNMSSMPTPISRKGMMEWRGEKSSPMPETYFNYGVYYLFQRFFSFFLSQVYIHRLIMKYTIAYNMLRRYLSFKHF